MVPSCWQRGGPIPVASDSEAGVSEIISNWARTSNDSSPTALPLQEAARLEFGLAKTATWRGTSTAVDEKAKEQLAENGDLYRAVLRIMYENTQADLKARHVDSLRLQRRVNNVRRRGIIEVSLRPMSSWSADSYTAASFTAVSM